VQSGSAQAGKWVIFDADNTLWDVESLYDDARRAFCRYAADLLGKRSPPAAHLIDLIEAMQRHRDLQLQETHGYSSARFARSFEDTLSFVLPFALAEELRHARGLAMRVFELQAVLADGLEAAILGMRPFYNLAIITAGEFWVQQRRIDMFSLREHFAKVIIVEKKSCKVFDRFCTDEGVLRDQSWVVGDSIRSDIIPALEAGLRVIHFEAPNWAHEAAPKPDGIPVARTMLDVLALVNTPAVGSCP
jgi:putative hydrolase of the HAD superfamily